MDGSTELHPAPCEAVCWPLIGQGLGILASDWLLQAPLSPLAHCEALCTGRAGNLGFMTRLEFEWKQQNYSLPASSLTNVLLTSRNL